MLKLQLLYVHERYVLYNHSLVLNHCIIAIEGRQRMESAYGQAMAALREARSGSIATLRQANWPKLSTWTHKYYCLVETDEKRVPSTSIKKNELVLAGLGEKNMTIPDVNCTPQEFQEALLNEFPKLQQGGGLNY